MNLMKPVDRGKNWDNEVEPRIEKLIKDGYYLEAFYLYSATIEFTLQSAIEFQERWVERLLSRSKMDFKRTKTSELQKLPLGALIAQFSKYCNDEKLVSELNEFNSFRKDVTHWLLDHKIESLNDTAKQKQLTYYRLVAKLSRYNVMMINKYSLSEKRRVKRNINSK